MNGGSKFLATTAVLALAGCGGSEGKLEIRSLPAPVSATAKPVPIRIAEAHGYLAVGNVGLAVESFRKALREQPGSVDAMVGLAASYDGMGRFDLSRRYFEQALAVVPNDARVLTAFARSLDAQGRAEEAAAVRAEVGLRLAAATSQPAPVGPSVTIALPALQPAVTTASVVPTKPRPAAAAPAAGRSITVKLPPAKATTASARPVRPQPGAPVPVDKPPVTPALPPVTRVAVSAAKPSVVSRPPQSPALAGAKTAAAPPVAPPAVAARQKLEAAAAMAAVKAAPAIVAPKKIEARVTAPTAPLSLPVVVTRSTLAEANPAAAPFAMPAPVAPVAAPEPAAPAAPPAVVPRNILEAAVVASPLVAAPAVVAGRAQGAPDPAPPMIAAPTIIERKVSAKLPSPGSAPRLARMSPGEVALVTTGLPQWRSKVVGRTAQSTTIRFVPLRKTEARPVRIRLLNAARQQGLAARTRAILAQRGWRKMAIGDASRVRQTSLILYPASRRSLALRLSAQFGFPIARRATGSDLVVLIGRDATKRGVVRTRA